jgi:hypothetical protein
MALDDVGAVMVLLYAGLGISAAVLWPATLWHAAWAVWAIALLARRTPRRVHGMNLEYAIQTSDVLLCDTCRSK